MVEDQVACDVRWMQVALEQARCAALEQEVPVGCVIIKNGQILGQEHNRREQNADPTAHAEILALQQAAKSVGHWRLEGATVYVTLEPCPMCAGALVNARIERLVYACPDPKAGACESLFQIGQDFRLNHRFFVTADICAQEAAVLLKDFFLTRRHQKKQKESPFWRDGRVVEGA